MTVSIIFPIIPDSFYGIQISEGFIDFIFFIDGYQLYVLMVWMSEDILHGHCLITLSGHVDIRNASAFIMSTSVILHDPAHQRKVLTFLQK